MKEKWYHFNAAIINIYRQQHNKSTSNYLQVRRDIKAYIQLFFSSEDLATRTMFGCCRTWRSNAFFSSVTVKTIPHIKQMSDVLSIKLFLRLRILSDTSAYVGLAVLNRTVVRLACHSWQILLAKYRP